MTEYIKREDVLRLVMMVETRENMYRCMKNIPAADVVERKTGKWIEHNDDFGLTYECSNCHIEGMINGNYCYNCGARMVEDDV